MKLAYVLPSPGAYADAAEFDRDLACMRAAGYYAVELQIEDPAEFDDARVRESLDAAGYRLCAFQTGGSYATRGNCLTSPDPGIRRRTVDLLLSFVGLAARWNAVMVVGTLQGRLSDEPDRAVAEARIHEALVELAEAATAKGAVVALEPVQHGEVGFHNTIAEVEAVVRAIGRPGLRMMVDTFHMNIEERDMLAPLAGIADILAHVHLCETNRDALGTGHWPTATFLAELDRIGYGGTVSVGVYNSRLPRRERIVRCMEAIR